MKKITMLMLSVVMTVCLIVAQSGFAGTYVGVPKGTIYRASVDYNDSNTVTITAGYGECNGHYWEITSPTNHDMTSLAVAGDYHYIYVDDSASDYPVPTIIDSNTEPAWSDSKLGWYNGDDRCIGAVWSPSGSATVAQFKTNTNLKYIFVQDANNIKVLINGNPTGNQEFLETTAYTPVNAIAILLSVSNRDNDGQVSVWLTLPETDGYQYVMDNSYGGTCSNNAWMELPKGASRDILWFGNNDDDNYYCISIRGYQIER